MGTRFGAPRRFLAFTVAKPTLKHRLALAPGMLGTLYAVSPAGEARYFDYDYEAARAWAELDAGTDIRYGPPPQRGVQYVRSGAVEANPNPHSRCYWVKRPEGVPS